LEEEKELKKLMAQNKPLVVTQEIEEQYKNATTCYICGGAFGVKGPTRDHDHMTAEFRGIACSRCKLLVKSNTKIQLFSTIFNCDSTSHHAIFRKFQID
jgi:hypothetical protein